MRNCTACAAGAIEAQSAGSSYKYCVPEMPTGFAAGTPVTIVLGNEMIHSYNFNTPTFIFTNNGSEGGTITVDTADPSGFPAKYRGLYFDGTNDGRIEMTSLVLYHSFTIQGWIYP